MNVTERGSAVIVVCSPYFQHLRSRAAPASRDTSLFLFLSSSSSSIGATTLGGFWPALRFRSTIFYLQFLTFIFFKSSSTLSSHLSLGLPAGHDERGFHSVTFLTIFVVSILITCAVYRNLCDFINLTIFFFLIRI